MNLQRPTQTGACAGNRRRPMVRRARFDLRASPAAGEHAVSPDASRFAAGAAHVMAVAQQHDIDVTALTDAGTFTAKKLADLQKLIRDKIGSDVPEGIDVVLCGSFGRQELTPGSDCDFLILVQSDVDADYISQLRLHVRDAARELQLEPPGATGLFGDFAIATELYGRVGLDTDSYPNATRRMLLITESVSALNPDVRRSTIDRILQRYCSDYGKQNTDQVRNRVPRFFLNDLMRYWRTITVDYAAKQWMDGREASHLRRVKLLTSRKILFAGTFATGLTASYLADDERRLSERIQEHIASQCDQTPLDRLMALHEKLGSDGQAALVRVLRAYCSFVSCMASEQDKSLIKNGFPDADHQSSNLRMRVEKITDDIQEGLEQIFFDDPYLASLTRSFGLF